jgi:thymidylate kinase
VVILDRYRLDTIVKLQYWYADVPAGLITWVVKRFAPEPDVELFLRVPSDVAYARKAEQWTASQLARQASLYDTVAALGKVAVLDASREPEVIAAEVRRCVESASHGC